MLFDPDKITVNKKTKCQSTAKKTKEKSIQARFGKRFDRCEKTIGDIKMDECIHYVSAGEWSMHDVLIHLLNQTGSADVWIASWSITEDPCRQLIKAIDAGAIKNLSILFDWRVKIRCPEAHQLAKATATQCYLTSCHAKTTVIQNDKWNIAIIGSANYTNNPRIESGIISCNQIAANFHREWIQKTIDRADPFEMEGKHVRKR